MHNHKLTNEKQNIRDILILDYIKNIHPEHLQPSFRITVEFIKLVFYINDKIRDCQAKFFKSDFTEDFTIKRLCTLIMDDGYNISINEKDGAIKWLNKLLKIPNLYNRIKRKKKRFNVSEFLMTFYPPGGKTEYSEFDKSDQQDILKFNRLLLEELYPNAVPKHLYSKTNLNFKCKGGMLDRNADDIFNNLPKEIICRPLDSKAIETIFYIFEQRAYGWIAHALSKELF